MLLECGLKYVTVTSSRYSLLLFVKNTSTGPSLVKTQENSLNLCFFRGNFAEKVVVGYSLLLYINLISDSHAKLTSNTEFLALNALV